MFRIRRDIREAEQNLIEQMRSAFGEGDAEQMGGQRAERSERANQLFSLIEKCPRR